MISVARWSPWREFADQPVGLVGEPAHVEQLGDAGADLAVGVVRQPRAQAVAGRDLDRDAQILAHADSSGKTSVIWKVRAMPRQTRRAGSRFDDVLAVEDDAAARSA